MPARGFSASTTVFFRAAILIIAPAVALVGHVSHPWIGSPGDAGFFQRLGAAVAADPTRWAASHLTVAVGSALVILAFVALRAHLRDAGEERWSALALPFVVLGSVFYALLPAMEFAPVGAHGAGGDIGATQVALMPWFVPVLMTAAALFALGVLGFTIAIVRSGAFGPVVTWTAVTALALMAITRFLPVGAAQLYVGPAAGLVALWPLAYAVWARKKARPAAHARPRAGPKAGVR